MTPRARTILARMCSRLCWVPGRPCTLTALRAIGRTLAPSKACGNPLVLGDADWKIYSRNPVMPPHYVAKGASMQNSLAAEGCNVYGAVDFSVLFAGVYVAPGAVVRDSIIMPGARIEEGAVVQYAIVAENSVVGANSVVGQRPEEMENKEDWGVAVIGPGCKLPVGSVVPPKAMIDAEEVEK